MVTGKDDGLIDARNAPLIADKLGGPTELHEIDGGHLLFFESFDPYTTLLARFWLERDAL